MNARLIWQEFLTIATEEVGSRVVETWLKAISVMAWDSATKTISLRAPNAFIKDWVMGQYSSLIKTHLCRLLNEKQVTLLFLDESRTEISTTIESQKGLIIPAIQDEIAKQKGGKPLPTRAILNPRYQFDSFVVGEHNDLAFAAAKSVAEEPGARYNPLFIYGSSGLGKTHLLQAIAHHFRTQNPQARVLYQTADRFVYEFITAIRADKAAAFEARYREIDILLIDDIHSIARKQQTQEALYHIFNALYESQKQIVFSSDTLPSKIEGLSPRFRSRLEGALIADIQPPCLKTKIAIIHKKADMQKETVQDDVAHLIASRTQNSVRELEGLLIRVLAFATLSHQVVSFDLAQRVLSRTMIETVRTASVDLSSIAQKVAKHYNYSMQELRSPKRHKNLTHARHVAMYLMKKMSGRSLIEIAAFLCRKDHSTVIHALEKIEQLQKSDDRFQRELLEIEKLCG